MNVKKVFFTDTYEKDDGIVGDGKRDECDKKCDGADGWGEDKWVGLKNIIKFSVIFLLFFFLLLSSLL